MTFEEAIKTAIELEKKVHRVYADAANAAGDPVGKKVFGLLASEESSHVNYLKKHLELWKENGTIRKDRIASVLPDEELIKKELAKVTAKLEGGDFSKELALLERARDVEIETSSFYQDAVSRLDGEGREFFSHFVKIENGHLALVEAEINAITGMGFWFDMPEFNLENA